MTDNPQQIVRIALQRYQSNMTRNQGVVTTVRKHPPGKRRVAENFMTNTR